MTPEYKAFIEACMAGFDENAVNPDDVLKAAERFGRIRACFLAGEPLPEDEHELQAVVAEFHKYASQQSSSLLREADRSLALLSEFCGFKSRAMRKRLSGKIAVATRIEAQAERTYNQLPKAWRW